MGDTDGVGCTVGQQQTGVDPQVAVDELFGAGRARVVDAVTNTRVTEREVILVNGVPVQLVGEDGEALKAALLAGRLPDQALINRVLASVLGQELRGVQKVESSLTMTSRVTTNDTLMVHQNGKVLDQKSTETTQDTRLQGSSTDMLHPLPQPSPSIFSTSTTSSNQSTSSTPSSLSSSPSPRPPSRSNNKSPSPVNGLSTSPPPARVRRRSSGSSNGGVGRKMSSNMNPDLTEALARTGLTDVQQNPRPKNCLYQPTIFGTVADDQVPRDNNTKRVLCDG